MEEVVMNKVTLLEREGEAIKEFWEDSGSQTRMEETDLN